MPAALCAMQGPFLCLGFPPPFFSASMRRPLGVYACAVPQSPARLIPREAANVQADIPIIQMNTRPVSGQIPQILRAVREPRENPQLGD